MEALENLQQYEDYDSIGIADTMTEEEKYAVCKKHFTKKLEEVIDSITGDDGVYHIYLDYRDIFDERTLADMYAKALKDGYVDEDIYYNFDYVIEDLYTYIDTEMKDIYLYYDEFLELNDFISDVPIDNGFTEMLRKSEIDLVLTLGEGGDYQANVKYLSEDRSESDIDADVIAFLNSQGVSTLEAYRYVRRRVEGLPTPKHYFLDSVMTELINSYGYNQITFLMRVDGETLINLALKRYKSVTIADDTTCGLVDFINGGGSVLGVRMQNSITIPIEKLDITPDISYRYGVTSIYGLISDVWENSSEWNENADNVNPEFK
jgi:hypothetical protein